MFDFYGLCVWVASVASLIGFHLEDVLLLLSAPFDSAPLPYLLPPGDVTLFPPTNTFPYLGPDPHDPLREGGGGIPRLFTSHIGQSNNIFDVPLCKACKTEVVFVGPRHPLIESMNLTAADSERRAAVRRV